ncbi:MAG: hypothetical protein V3S98_04080 [Dehalococcoidia bacterium]
MAVDTCHWHPDRETGLHCSNCGKAMCVECMRQHPVGIRCKECAKLNRLPTYQVSASYAARGIGAAIGMGILGSVGLYVVFSILPAAGFFFFIIMGGLGYAIAAGVAAAVNYRRGRPYQYMALGGVLLATAPLALSSLFVVGIGALLNLVGVGIAGVIAWNRLRV